MLEWYNIGTMPRTCLKTSSCLASTMFLIFFSWPGPLPLTLPERESLMLMLREHVTGFPLLIMRLQPPIRPLFAHSQNGSGSVQIWRERPDSYIHDTLFPPFKPTPRNVSHQSVLLASSLHSFFISCQHLSILFLYQPAALVYSMSISQTPSPPYALSNFH